MSGWLCRVDGMGHAAVGGAVVKAEEPDLMAQAAAGHDDLMTGNAPAPVRPRIIPLHAVVRSFTVAPLIFVAFGHNCWVLEV